MLGIEAPEEDEVMVPVRRSQDERWNTNLTAAWQFHPREGYLRPGRQHIEVISVDGGGAGVGQQAVKLGALVDNTRRRAAKLSPERRAALDELGMRW